MASSSNRERGWNGFGAMSATASSRTEGGAPSMTAVAGGISASRPLPRAFRCIPQNLLDESVSPPDRLGRAGRCTPADRRRLQNLLYQFAILRLHSVQLEPMLQPWPGRLG